MSVMEIVWRYSDALSAGLAVTLRLCAIVWLVGITIGGVLGIIASRWPRGIGVPVRVASTVLAAIPIIVFLFWLHYPAQMVLGVVVNPFITAAAALTTVNAVLVADLVRGAAVDLPQQYRTAAMACGLAWSDTVRFITAPLLMRQLLPGVLSLQIVMLQASLFASLISVDEIFRVVQRINAEIYRPVEIYTGLALLFIAVCVPLHVLANHLRRRFTRDTSEV